MTETQALPESEFWRLIESAFDPDDADIEEGIDELRRVMTAWPREKVVSFQRTLNAQMQRAYRWNLIAASCVVGAGQSDDGFEDFRAWLITRGQAVFERVLSDPSELATLPFEESPLEEWNGEEFHMLPGEVGGEEDDDDWPYGPDEDPSGTPIELNKANLSRLFPRLWSRFGDEYMIVD